MFDNAKKWLLMGAVMLIMACGNKDKAIKIPKNIIPPTEMVCVLVDWVVLFVLLMSCRWAR